MTPESGRKSEENRRDSSAPANPNPTASDSSRWMKFAGLGIELSSITLGCAGIGYLVDHLYGNPKPFGAALGTLIGFTFGMYRFIRRVSPQPPK
ncbi:MAG: AtpZ/AtpI family protein [Pirellulaceae bacterium]|nr:AtpZ/AtpI family protein [Pirellulaceae bacterium]